MSSALPPLLTLGRIVLLEDDPAHEMLIKRALRAQVGQIESARTVLECRKLLDKSSDDALPPELLIADLNLPDSHGIQHIADFVTRFPELPIIVLTSSDWSRDREEASRLGALMYLRKGSSLDEFLAIGETLRVAVEQHQSAQ